MLHAVSASEASVLIYDRILAADAANIDVQNIPATYRNLLVLANLRMVTGTGPFSISFRFNNDTGSNYEVHYLQLNNTTVTGTHGALASGAAALLGGSADAAANIYAPNRVLIFDYAGTTRVKSFLAEASAFSDTAADSYVRIGGGNWRSTAAIDRITVLDTAAGSDFLSGSQLTIYGNN